MAEADTRPASDNPENGAGVEYRVETVERIGSTWDELVAGFVDGCLEQTGAVMGARWDTSRLVGLVLRDGATDAPVAAALAVIAMLPLLQIGLAYVKFGPLWRRRSTLPATVAEPSGFVTFNGAAAGTASPAGQRCAV